MWGKLGSANVTYLNIGAYAGLPSRSEKSLP